MRFTSGTPFEHRFSLGARGHVVRLARDDYFIIVQPVRLIDFEA